MVLDPEQQPPNARQAVADLATLPIGWTERARIDWKSNPAVVALGWFITALAALFGAPFWFDTLRQIARLKGTGPSPSEKKADIAAAA